MKETRELVPLVVVDGLAPSETRDQGRREIARHLPCSYGERDEKERSFCTRLGKRGSSFSHTELERPIRQTDGQPNAAPSPDDVLWARELSHN